MSDKRCEWCRVEYADGRPDYYGSDPQCAFPNGVFRTVNWSCAGLHRLRDDAEAVEVWNDDQHCAVLPFPDSCDFVVLSYYKHRGNTEGAWLVCDHIMRPLTTQDVRAYLQQKADHE